MKSISTVTLLALATSQALAASTNPQLEETIVTSSRIEMPLREVATSVSVVSKEDIEIRGFSSLANVLRYEPAISVVSNGGAGKTTELGIRGERGYRTKVYIDGMDVTDTSTPQAGPNFGNLSSAGIERVEILRGPQGMMYGADAGGVINISTLSPSPGLGGTVSAEYGRYDTQQYDANIAGGSDMLDFSVLASHYETDGFNSRTTDTSKDKDGYENDTFHARVGWNITESVRAELVGRKVEGDNEFDSCSIPPNFDPTDNCTNEYDQEAWRAAISQRGDVFSNALSYNLHNSDREFFSVGISTFAAEGELEKIEYLGSWTPNKGTAVIYGFELQNESLDDGSESSERDQDGYFAEYQGGFNDTFFITAGVRYDDNDDFGTETTYRVSGAYLIPASAGEYKIKGSYGTGFRAPSLSEIAYNNSFNAFLPASNVELSAETSEGWEMGAGFYANSGWSLDVVYFDQRTEDEIFFDLADFSGYLQGDGESSSRGVEVIGEFPLSETVAVTANYTYNDTEDAEGETRIRAPKNLANVGFQVTPLGDRLTVSVHLRISRDSAVESAGAVDDYEVVDLSATYQVLESLELYGRIENLLDQDYQEIPTFNTSGAAGYAGVRYTF